MSVFVFGCRTKYNLNALSHDTAISLIEKVLADGVKLTEVNTHTLTPSHPHTHTREGVCGHSGRPREVPSQAVAAISPDLCDCGKESRQSLSHS